MRNENQSQGPNQVVHPEGKICLTNGSLLDGYPKAVCPEQTETNSLALDESGVFLQIDREKPRSLAEKADEQKELKRLFLENAFLFYNKAEHILGDSRLFLTPVPFQNGLAYTGINGFRHPTLGVYIEWWKSYPNTLQQDRKGKNWLVYHLAGSPLSGRNSSSRVNEKGESKGVTLCKFIDYWGPFQKINTRYTEVKQRYKGFTLREAIEVLRETI